LRFLGGLGGLCARVFSGHVSRQARQGRKERQDYFSLVKAYFLGGLSGLCARQFFPIIFRAKHAKSAKIIFLLLKLISLAALAVFARDSLFRPCSRQAR
jgi:hypothetical protein